MARNNKYSYNKITSLSQDWSHDTSNGKQYAGEVVQEFIKEQLTDLGNADTEIKGRLDDVESFDSQADERMTQMEGQMSGVIETAAADHERAEADHATSQEWNDHPPFIGDGRTGDKNYWYLYDITTSQYIKGPYAKGDDIDWTTMSQEEYERLVENVKQDLVFATAYTCEDIIDELS